MGIEEERLDHLLAEGGAGAPVITSALYCEQCGYELRMLPYVGRCPECGNHYHARGIKMHGIFIPQTAEFPASTIAAALASAALVTWLIAGLVQRFDLWSLIFAGIFGALAVVFTRQSWRELKLFIRGQKLSARDDDE